jgi:hypothetical protein
MTTANDLKVFITGRDSRCDKCQEDLGRHAWITLEGDSRALCLACADLDHLVFLPSGDAALTRRARKHARLSAVVLKWSRARKRYERQGLLVEDAALTQAEAECDADASTRAARRDHAAARRAELDQEYVTRFAARVRELYPHCPDRRETLIAEHACRKYSGRIGRSAGAKAFDPEAIRMAVIAHIRHTETPYDDFLLGGHDRHDARARVRGLIDEILRTWQG